MLPGLLHVCGAARRIAGTMPAGQGRPQGRFSGRHRMNDVSPRARRAATAGKVLTAMTALLLVAASGVSVAQQRTPAVHQWKKHTFPDDRFEVEFSGPIRSEPVKLDPATRKKVTRSMQHLQDGGSFVFIVGAQQNVDTVNFDAGVQGSFGALKCQSGLTDGPVTLTGGRGRELKGTDCFDGSMRAEARYFEVGKWFYQLISIFPKDGVEEPAARRFLESFKPITP